MRNRNDFRCKDCRYYQTLFLYHENMEDYYETDYGLCVDFDVSRPVRFDEDAAAISGAGTSPPARSTRNIWTSCAGPNFRMIFILNPLDSTALFGYNI